MERLLNKSKSHSKIDKNSKTCGELLVFGYSCKFFEPTDDFDEHSTKYLIPLHGNENNKIDRYDCRLYLDPSELTEIENVSTINTHTNSTATHSAELLEEELCEDERYKDLSYNANGDDIPQNENPFPGTPKLKKTGSAIGFSYENAKAESSKTTVFGLNFDESDDLKPYIVPENLKLPVGIIKPETAKQGMIIEKTALFSVKNGPQMEVVLKAKFGRSPLFGFLDFDHILHPIFKYICKQIREKKYTPNFETKIEKQENLTNEESDATDSDDDGELHPLLTSSARREPRDETGLQYFGPELKPKEIIKNEPAIDINALVQHFHRDNPRNSIYESLMDNLTNVIPGTQKINRIDEQIFEEEKKPIENGQYQLYETDEQTIQSYNAWHLSFYGRPSPYLNAPLPKILPVPPDLSSSVSLAARYVALNGPFAERKLIEHNRDAVEFLLPTSPYYTFYQSRVRAVHETVFYHQAQNISNQQKVNEPKTDQEQGTSYSIKNTLSSPEPLIKAQIKVESSLVPHEILPGTLERPLILAEVPDHSLDPKQNERREKARLFMERILNEKLVGKRSERRSREHKSHSPVERQDHSASPSTSEIQDKMLSSTIVDKQPDQVHLMKTPTSMESHDSDSKSQKRKRTRSKSLSTSSSSDDEDRRRRRRKRRHHNRRRSRDRSIERRYHRRRSRSRSRGSSGSRKREHHRF